MIKMNSKKARILTLLFLIALVTIKTASAEDSCETCHPGPAKDFSKSSMAEFLECIDCHGSEHNGPGTSGPTEVTPRTCEKCHEEKVAEFSSGKHALGWEAMEAVPTYHVMPARARRMAVKEDAIRVTPVTHSQRRKRANLSLVGHAIRGIILNTRCGRTQNMECFTLWIKIELQPVLHVTRVIML